MDHVVRSRDGTRIAAERSGSGPAVVLVHGAIGDRTSFRAVVPLLADRYEVLVVDRRGHGASEDPTDPYSIDREAEDLVAMVESIGRPAVVLGHSYGATVTIAALPLTTSIAGALLYEPSPGIAAAGPDLCQRLDAAIDRGDRDAALALALEEFAGFAPDDVDAYRRTPLWAPRIAAAHTITREVRAEERYEPEPASFVGVRIPTRFLLGEASPAWAREGAERVRRLLPATEVVMLMGQEHMATVTAPALLAAEIDRLVGDIGIRPR